MKTIKSLKKEAKELRKNNNKIKNQSESLNIIAKKYGKSCWQDILNASVFIEDTKIEKEFKDFQYSNDILIRITELISITMIIKRSNIWLIRNHYLRNKSSNEEIKKAIELIENLSDELHNIQFLINSKDNSKENVLNSLDSHIKRSNSSLNAPIMNEWIKLFKKMKEEIISY